MDAISLSLLAEIAGGELRGARGEERVSSVAIDSRHLGTEPAFFALAGSRTDGHRFVGHALEQGAVAAVVTRRWLEGTERTPAGTLVAVEDPLRSLQRLASWWRGRLAGKVVAVTGSNGKTIVKDALLHLLAGSRRAAGSIGSYNSQLGVPLALLRIPREVEVAVLEAGISAPGEMASLAAMLRPDCGILTNVGLAHIAAFGSRAAIAREKVKLFAGVEAPGWVLLPAEVPSLEELAGELPGRVLRVGGGDGELPRLAATARGRDGLEAVLEMPSGERFEVPTRTPSPEILTDLEIAASAASLLGVPGPEIAAALSGYAPPHTRMEIWRSAHRRITLVNDACSSDPVSVEAALRALDNLESGTGRRIFVFGGMRELGELREPEHAAIGRMAAQHRVDPLVLVGGSQLDATEEAFRAGSPEGRVLRLEGPEGLASQLGEDLEPGDVVLLKGPRNLGIDRAAQGLLDAIAPNRFLLDLGAVAENVSLFRRAVGPATKVLGMVKALAYGSDAVRLSAELEGLGLDWLGVANPDEGAALRRSGVSLPILVTLCTADEVDKLLRYDLTPVLYSPELVEPMAAAARRRDRPLGVHLEVDTGLGRLGQFPGDLPELARRARETGWLEVVGLMTHFASADDPKQDAFTRRQIALFRESISALEELGFRDLLCHAAATAGALRFPESGFGMVRIGLGLFGVHPSAAVREAQELHLAVSLLSKVTGVRLFEAGASIGYNRTYQVERGRFRAGVVPIGYADGVPWALSNGGTVLVEGRPVPIVGRISMDSLVVDLSEVPEAHEGSDVLVYGRHGGRELRPEEVAERSGTIVYELLARLGARVEKMFVRA